MENSFIHKNMGKSIDHGFNFTGKITFLIYFMPCTFIIRLKIKQIIRNKYIINIMDIKLK